MTNKLSTDPYKGVRDFYPEDMWILKYMTEKIHTVVERFGYVEYTASILEPAELYRAKSGEEIVNDQTYTFTDRGNREVTLRPEMTPTVARMVAARKRELPFPLRWYSIPNLFRYEQPQRGRLREHYQLNVDVFGISGLSAEVEVIQVASGIMKAFGATDSDFSILINSRKLLSKLFETFNINSEQSYTISKLIDKKEKVTPEVFEEGITAIIGDKAKDFIALLSSPEKLMEHVGVDHESVKTIVNLIETFETLGIKNIEFTPTLMRGFDYYTDIVFEIFDTNKDNRRSLFGGGRYDNLLELFGGDSIPAVGFGMGDVTLRDFLESHKLLPPYVSETNVLLATIGPVDETAVTLLAQSLREKGITVATHFTAKKPADAIKTALKLEIPYMVFIGEDEIAKKQFTLKNLKTEETQTLSLEELAQKITS